MKGKFFATGIFLILGMTILFMIIPSPYNANMNSNVVRKVFADDGGGGGDDGGDKQGSSNDEQDSNDAPQEDKQETNEEVNDEPKEQYGLTSSR